ncbi:MAG: NEW3 domain-containing protein [Chloroflexi bacterium]|nr:NEW3 domain-containing protein [Chloroflexota bacterium]
MKRMTFAFALVPLLALVTLTPGVAFGDAPGSAAPAVVTTAYPAIVADAGTTLTFSIDVSNTTQALQVYTLKADGPSDWSPSFTGNGMTIREVTVEPGKSQSVNLELRPPDTAKPQDYTFVVSAADQSGAASKSLSLDVTLRSKTDQGSLKLTTQYPDLRGQANGSFSFTLTAANNADQDRTVNFDTTLPQDWQATIKPAYQTTQVSAISLKANSTQDIDVSVTPPQDAPAGQYPVVVRASAGGDSTQIPLNVVIVGNAGLSLDTSSGQLNTQATVDSATKVTLVVKNTGSAPLNGVSVTASTPSGWNVSFSPSTIDSLPVNQSTQVDATITPGTRALAGDYMVSMTASAGSTSDSKDIRVTVQTPTTWGWAAVAAIALVVIMLGAVFARYSRR